ncbi:MAG TPA: DNA polymerase III subunit chi [Burkholderiaceae bacterium]|jgi:DNA polymerase-3 subunit chi|nr:DNA polymerase III subunit chi [Burkholderiaceae bacterium]
MTRIDFHFNVPDKIQYGCRLLRKIQRAGQRAVVYAPPAALASLDSELWSFSPLDFIAHVPASHPLAASTPILLCSEPVETAHSDVLVNLAPQMPSFFSRFERLIELVSAGDDDRAAGRERWRFYKERGYPLTSFDVTASAQAQT